MTTPSAGTNAFEDSLAERYGDGKDMGELLASLTNDEMLDYIRNLNWSRKKQTNNYSRWWIGKEVSAGEQELDRRGIDRDSWRTQLGNG